MIGRLTGKITTCTPAEVLVDVGGVGYALRIPLSTYYPLAGRGNGTVSLHVHTHVREDALELFGFWTVAERSIFERLLSISGVGPRMALAVLSGIEPADLEAAVLEGDRARLERIPGIGRKTAERILLELRDRIDQDPRKKRPRTGGGDDEASATGSGPIHDDAVSALRNLGYGRDPAVKAVNRALDELGADATLENVLRGALRGLVRRG